MILVSWGNPICCVIDAVYGKRNDMRNHRNKMHAAEFYFFFSSRLYFVCFFSFSSFLFQERSEKPKKKRFKEKKEINSFTKLSSKKLVLLYSIRFLDEIIFCFFFISYSAAVAITWNIHLLCMLFSLFHCFEGSVY